MSTRIAPFIALARDADWSEQDPLGEEVRAQLQALGARAVAPLFAAVTRCEPESLLSNCQLDGKLTAYAPTRVLLENCVIVAWLIVLHSP